MRSGFRRRRRVVCGSRCPLRRESGKQDHISMLLSSVDLFLGVLPHINARRTQPLCELESKIERFKETGNHIHAYPPSAHRP